MKPEMNSDPMQIDQPRVFPRRGTARLRRMLFVLAALATLVTLIVLGLPRVRNHAMSDLTRRVSRNIPGYNLHFAWEDSFGERGFRGLMYPHYTDPPPWEVPYSTSDKTNPLHGYVDRGEIYYGGNRIICPPDKDTAVVALDGSISFIELAPKYLNYGKSESATSGIFTASKGFPLIDDSLKIEALKKDGLLPGWAVLEGNDAEESSWKKVQDAQATESSVSYSYVWSKVTGYLILLFLLAPVPFLRKSKMRTDRARRGLCPNCGYDLRGGHQRCPECGTEVDRAPA